MAREPTHVILIGPMGVGKTTIGRALADRLGLPFRDSDEVIERTTSTDGATIALAEGVDELHRLEAWAAETLTAYRDRSVIAAAASVVDRPEGRELLRAHLTIWLDADPEVLEHRRRRSRHRREVDANESLRLRSLRSAPYRSVSAARVDTSTEPVAAIVDRLAAIVERNRVRPRPDPDIVHRPPSEREQP